MTELAFESGLALAEKIRKQEVGCLELLDYFLERAHRLNPKLNAIIEWDEERARARAREADAALVRGEIWGPLHGVPMTVKESYDVAGLHTTRGNPVYRDNVARRDALAITRLRQAGAVIFGKSNVPLNLADFQSYNEIYGTTNNPWDTARGPGGSSGGSAAVLAAGLAPLETGSDIGGSIRNPAHFCGVFGHKPTWGLLPPRGHAAPGVLAQSDLTVIGPLARTATDCEALTLAMAGPDEIHAAGYRLALQPSPFASLADVKAAVLIDHPRARVSQAVQGRVQAVADAIRAAGGSVDFEARPDIDLDAGHANYQMLLWSVMASRNPEDAYLKLQAQAATLDPADDSAQAQVLRAQVASFRDYSLANEHRTRQRWAWHEFFRRYDVLISPIMATAAFPHDHRPFGERSLDVDGETRPYFEQLFWAGLAIASYLPATVIPTGGHPDFADATLPIGVQIIGPEFGDLKTLGIAKLLEAAGFGFMPPPGY